MERHLSDALMLAAPIGRWRIQPMGPGKPAIFVGEEAMLRYRDSSEGEACAKLAVEAVNALLKPASTTASSNAAQSPIEALMEEQIAKVLALQPAFQKAPTKILTRLLFAALQPLIIPANIGERSLATGSSTPAPVAMEDKTVKAARLKAVEEFCDYLLRHGDTHYLPSEDALTAFVTSWDNSENSILPMNNAA